MIQLSTGDMLRAAKTRHRHGRQGCRHHGRGRAGRRDRHRADRGTARPEPRGSFIFDGFPRTLPQADALGALLARHGKSLDAVIEMQVNDDVLVGRIVGRAEEAAKAGQPVRADDNEESLRVRLMEYYKKTSPLIGYYWAKGDLKSVDGLGTIDEVAAEIAGILDA
ncbi:MAG: nucleoside monophosphate kinase [Paracoccaceae bacterium]